MFSEKFYQYLTLLTERLIRSRYAASRAEWSLWGGGTSQDESYEKIMDIYIESSVAAEDRIRDASDDGF